MDKDGVWLVVVGVLCVIGAQRGRSAQLEGHVACGVQRAKHRSATLNQDNPGKRAGTQMARWEMAKAPDDHVTGFLGTTTGSNSLEGEGGA